MKLLLEHEVDVKTVADGLADSLGERVGIYSTGDIMNKYLAERREVLLPDRFVGVNLLDGDPDQRYDYIVIARRGSKPGLKAESQCFDIYGDKIRPAQVARLKKQLNQKETKLST